MAKLEIKMLNTFALSSTTPPGHPMRSNLLYVNGKHFASYLSVVLLSDSAWVATDMTTRHDTLYVCGKPLSTFESIKRLTFFDENNWHVGGKVISGLTEQDAEIYTLYDSINTGSDPHDVEASMMVDNNNFFWINKKDGLVRVCIENVYFGAYAEANWNGTSLFVREINTRKKLPLHVKSQQTHGYIMRIH